MTKEIFGVPFEVKESKNSWILTSGDENFDVQLKFSKKDFDSLDSAIEKLKSKLNERK